MTERSWIDRTPDDFDRESVKENIALIRAKADAYGAKVVAATKTVPAETVKFALDSGLEYMGENRVQELLFKYDDIAVSPERVHFIGRLQTNKVRQIIGKVSLIHSLDSLRLAGEISKRSLAAGIVTDCLCEINIGCEESKSGVAPDGAEQLILEASKLEGIRIKGLMSIGPHFENTEDYRPYMQNVADLFRRLSDKGLFGDRPELSMGMSDNYSLALEYGATIIRPGTAIFGKRIYK